MYNIIKNYVENEATNGLILIDMPTGSGKTYSAIEYIFDACLNENNKSRKYIFVTTLKKFPFIISFFEGSHNQFYIGLR